MPQWQASNGGMANGSVGRAVGNGMSGAIEAGFLNDCIALGEIGNDGAMANCMPSSAAESVW